MKNQYDEKPTYQKKYPGVIDYIDLIYNSFAEHDEDDKQISNSNNYIKR
jgi:hypothetical protein